VADVTLLLPLAPYSFYALRLLYCDITSCYYVVWNGKQS